jgi:hypothetical protein
LTSRLRRYLAVSSRLRMLRTVVLVRGSLASPLKPPPPSSSSAAAHIGGGGGGGGGELGVVGILERAQALDLGLGLGLLAKLVQLLIAIDDTLNSDGIVAVPAVVLGRVVELDRGGWHVLDGDHVARLPGADLARSLHAVFRLVTHGAAVGARTRAKAATPLTPPPWCRGRTTGQTTTIWRRFSSCGAGV